MAPPILTAVAIIIWFGFTSIEFAKLGVRRIFNDTKNNGRQIKEPYFNGSVTMEIKPHQNLLYYMERAVDEYRAIFTGFKATYFSELGFFIDSINNLAGNFAEDQTYWQILNSTGPLDVGVSSYVPRDEDSILFNFTVYTNHSSTV